MIWEQNIKDTVQILLLHFLHQENSMKNKSKSNYLNISNKRIIYNAVLDAQNKVN